MDKIEDAFDTFYNEFKDWTKKQILHRTFDIILNDTEEIGEKDKEIKRLNNIIDDLKQKNNLAENILYDYLYNDDKITKEKYEEFKGLKEGKQC